MEYGRLIADSWRLTWRHRFLWFFGIFAGSSGFNCSLPGGNVGGDGDVGDAERLAPDVVGGGAEVVRLLQENASLVAGLVCLVLLLVLAVLALSLISQGALMSAAARLDRGEAVTFGEAWRAGLAVFWRLAGLYLVTILIAMAILIVLLPAFLLFFGGVLAGGDAGGAPWAGPGLIVLGVIALLIGVLIAIPLFIALTIVVTYATRGIGVEGRSIGASLMASWLLFRRRPGDSLILWLISLALAIGGGFVVLVGLLLLAIPLAIVVALLFLLAGNTAGIAGAIVAALAAFLILLVLAGALNAFLWNYWTLGYMRLRAEA